MKYITKPTIIEAEQFVPNKENPVYPKGMHPWPDEHGAQPRDMSWGYCDTRQGRVHVQAHDWIITLPDGESYPCKPDVFENKYKPVDKETAKELTYTQRQVFSLINSVVAVANKFIIKVNDGRAKSVETYADMQQIRNESLILKKQLEEEING